MTAGAVRLFVAGSIASAANAPPLWILQQNRRAAEDYQRNQSKRVTGPAPARTPTLAVPTPARLDP
jgi:hypothetical protein